MYNGNDYWDIKKSLILHYNSSKTQQFNVEVNLCISIPNDAHVLYIYLYA